MRYALGGVGGRGRPRTRPVSTLWPAVPFPRCGRQRTDRARPGPAAALRGVAEYPQSGVAEHRAGLGLGGEVVLEKAERPRSLRAGCYGIWGEDGLKGTRESAGDSLGG